jgi:hypothetical protein
MILTEYGISILSKIYYPGRILDQTGQYVYHYIFKYVSINDEWMKHFWDNCSHQYDEYFRLITFSLYSMSAVELSSLYILEDYNQYS